MGVCVIEQDLAFRQQMKRHMKYDEIQMEIDQGLRMRKGISRSRCMVLFGDGQIVKSIAVLMFQSQGAATEAPFTGIRNSVHALARIAIC
jgi:hypothetical protein